MEKHMPRKKHRQVFLMLLFSLFLSLLLFGCSNESKNGQQNLPNGKIQETEDEESIKDTVQSVVKNFGKRLQNVSLLAPEDVLKKSMEENYAEYVSSFLLEQWEQDTSKAPGRLTSSPWPDRIEIFSMEKISQTSYLVEGEIIEVTNAVKGNGEIVARRAITLEVEKSGEDWLIKGVDLGAYKEGADAADSGGSSPVVYENAQYKFKFVLPESWKKYAVVTSEWEGLGLGSAQEGQVVEKGTFISLRHPQWTAEKPRQDIPILIFTLKQWKALQQEKFHIGAAPMGPQELGRNSQYVFALPARYNYAFPEGYEEVEEILESKPLQVF